MKTPVRHALVGAVALTAALSLNACALTSSGDTAEADTIEIAYLSASSANTWLAASAKEMKALAEKDGVKITEFDAKFEAGKTAKQIQDVIAAKKYDGIIVATIDGVGAAPAIEEAIAAGIKVVILNQIVGEKLDTADPQVEGVSASVLAPPTGTGERLGQLTVKACEGFNPCDVVYMYGIKGSPVDTAVRQGWESVISQTPGITVIAEAEGGFLGTDEPRKAMQDVLQAHPTFQVLAGAGDQQILGANLALEAAGKTDVRAVSVGGSEPAIAAIKAKTWFGDVAGVPVDEGKAAYEAMMAAIKDGTVSGGIDVVSNLPDGGLITQDNVGDFTAQWAG